MGLKDLLRRWTKGEDERAIERAEERTRMTPVERDVDREDFEARKDDVASMSQWPGQQAAEAARDDLDETNRPRP